jgi:hypothetical protein
VLHNWGARATDLAGVEAYTAVVASAFSADNV